jgi:hypothetical protein
MPATRPSYVIAQPPPPAANSAPGRAAARAPQQLLPPALEPCLIVVINRTSEAVSLSARSETPAGSSFLDALSVDLEPEGLVSFSACPASDLVVDFFRGPHVLALLGNELRLLPGGGLKQKMTFAPSSFPTKHVLVVEVERLVESSSEPARLALADVVLGICDTEPEMKEALRRSLEALPAHCTVLWPRGRIPAALSGLSAEDLVRRLTVPMALFFHSSKGCSETLLDNSTLRIAVSSAGEIIFEVPGEGVGVKGALFFKSSAAGLVRTTERFQLVYLCDVSAR